MENTINFGIDLGTTNSAIAKFVKGEVTVFSNPRDYGRRTLPSVVGFKKDKIIVGSKAKELWEKDGKNVVGAFKRKMGTSESFPIKAIQRSVTPIELSAQVLKELKTFIQTGENIDAAVITIPASFDTIQSNATKEAGIGAGFNQVILLQEPIAASLAYANQAKERELQDGQWLVYDLGGGTFDVALIKITDGEMKVLDHEGDNFLGGTDFDQLIVEKIIIPFLEKKGSFSNLEKEMKSASGKYNRNYLKFLHNSELAKIELSARTSAEIELIIEDDEGKEIDTVLTLTRSEFEELIKEAIDETVSMVKKIITRNSLTPQDLQFVLMVGGSTFIPYVRQRVNEMIGIPINCEIDPTTAVAIGAAYFAGTKPKQSAPNESHKHVAIKVKMAYQKATKEKEEFFAAKFAGQIDGLFYRIDREDGGFTTGLKPLKKQIQEELPLVESAFNFFTLSVYDAQNNLIETDAETIGINSGYAVSGQPLPHDICLEVDDPDYPGKTKLELVFQKNSILPTKRTITKALNKTIVKGTDDHLRINVLEGTHTALPEANQSIGYMEIKGTQLARDVSRGSDIEITIDISESRDVTISVYLTMLDQEFKQVFTPKERHTPVHVLQEQVAELSSGLEKEIAEAVEREDYETAKSLQKIQPSLEEINQSASNLSGDDVTDKKYQLEDKKRKLAQEIDNATRDKRTQIAKSQYFDAKEKCLALMEEYGNDYERKVVGDITKQESTFLTSNNPLKIQEKTDKLTAIMAQILWRTPQFLISMFKELATNQIARYNNLDQAKSLIDAGKFSIQNQNWDRLGEVNHALINLLPNTAQQEITTKIGF